MQNRLRPGGRRVSSQKRPHQTFHVRSATGMICWCGAATAVQYIPALVQMGCNDNKISALSDFGWLLKVAMVFFLRVSFLAFMGSLFLFKSILFQNHPLKTLARAIIFALMILNNQESRTSGKVLDQRSRELDIQKEPPDMSFPNEGQKDAKLSERLKGKQVLLLHFRANGLSS